MSKQEMIALGLTAEELETVAAAQSILTAEELEIVESVLKEIIEYAIEFDAPITIITNNGTEHYGWVTERHTDDEGVWISPGYTVPFEDIDRGSVKSPLGMFHWRRPK